MKKQIWVYAEFVFRLLVVATSAFRGQFLFISRSASQAGAFLNQPFSGPRSEMLQGGNLVSKAKTAITRGSDEFLGRLSFVRAHARSHARLRASWPWTTGTWNGRTIILVIGDQSVDFHLADEADVLSFVLSSPQSSWSEILLPLGRLVREVQATEIVALCSHHSPDSVPIQSIRGVLYHHPDDLLYLPPVLKDLKFDRWVLDGAGRITQSEGVSAWWDVLVDRQTSVAPGFPVAMAPDTLRFASDYLTDMRPDAASVAKLGLWLQKSGRAVWEMRESSTVTSDADSIKCSREFPKFAASLAQTLVSEFHHVTTALQTQEKRMEPAERLSAIEGKPRNPLSIDENRRPLKILYLSPVATHPTNHGNRRTMVSFGQIFKDAGHEILFASPMDWNTTATDIQQMEDFWGSVETLPPSGTPVGPYGVDFDSWITPELCSRVRYLCIQNEIDVVFCSYVWFSAALNYVPGYITKILDTHDKFSDRYAMLESRGLPTEFFSCTPEEEARYLSRADVVLARRSEEATYFGSLIPGLTVEVVTHIDRPKRVPAPPEEKRVRFGFLASRNQVNSTILTEFLDAIIAFDGKLDFELVIAGQVTDLLPSPLLKASSKTLEGRVQTLGFVETPEDFYSKIHCAVSPVSLGTGVNVKTLEALSFGMPMLSTEHGSKGTGSTLREHNFVSVEALVEAMSSLRFPDLRWLRKESERIAENLWLENSARLLSLVTRGQNGE